jgi:tripartite-type tricarboxylate transporter receptor subunit TctC
MSLFRGKSHRTSQGQNRDTPSITRRRVSAGLLATGLAPFPMARAEPIFPGAQPLKLLVGFPAGGSQDNIGRILADRLAMHWKTPVIVENVAGAGSNIAFDRVAKGPADGSQILIVPPGLATNQFLYPKLAFDPVKDFTPLALVATVPNLLCVRNSLPVNSMAELIAYAKANPGKLNYGSTGIGTTPHLASEMLKRMAGIDFATVHYRGSAPALNDLLTGATDMVIDNTTSIAPHARAGSVRALGISTLKRWPLGRDYAPIADTLPGYQALAWSGVAVRAGTPKAICDSIETAVKAVCREPALKERMSGLLAEVVGSGSREFGAFLAVERATWGKLITDLNIRVGTN